MPRKPTGRPPGRPRKTVPAAAEKPVAPATDLCGECWPSGWDSVHSAHEAVACVHGHFARAFADWDSAEDSVYDEDEGDELDEDSEDEE